MDVRQLLDIDAQLRTKPGRGRTYEPDWPNLLQRTETVGTPDLKAWVRAVLEQPDGEPAIVFQVAGMQDHRYRRTPWETPARGSRVELLHNPENPTDPDAVEVRFAYQIMGHAPADLAYVLAPLLDQGLVADAWVADPGNSYSWSLEVMLLGEAARAGVAARREREAEVRVEWVRREAEQGAWAVDVWTAEDRAGPRSDEEANAFGGEVNSRRFRRRQDLATAFEVPVEYVAYQQMRSTMAPYIYFTTFGHYTGWIAPETVKETTAA